MRGFRPQPARFPTVGLRQPAMARLMGGMCPGIVGGLADKNPARSTDSRNGFNQDCSGLSDGSMS